MGKFKLSRRTILRGAGGAALALPALEIMAPQRASAADGEACRFVVMYGGISIAADNNDNLVVPDTVGPNYDLKQGILPLGPGALPSNPGVGGTGSDVQDHVSIVTGLKVPWDSGSGIPPGGKSPEFHYNSIGPQTSGVAAGPGRTERSNGPTADQIVGDAIGSDTLHHSLSYRVQAASYVGGNSTGGDSARISYRDDGGGGLEAIDPTFSPELAYQSLFSSFVPPDPADAQAAQFLLSRRQSVVDLVRDKTETLVGKLGSEDRKRMERHLDEIRDLENRLDAIPPSGGDCEQPADPGADPPIEGAAKEYQGQGGDGLGYSNEDLRAEVLVDLITMAFACDLTRSAAVRFTFTQCMLQMGPLMGHPGDLHEIGHNGQQVPFADGFSWHVKHFARLISRLRDTRGLDGSSVLDHTAVVLLFEGGQGFDPESGNGGQRAHSTENMVAFVGGHAGGLNPTGGKHIVKTDWHPANAVISCMYGCGVRQDTEQLGDITGRIPELFE